MMPKTHESQQRFGNRNAANRLEKQMARLEAAMPAPRTAPKLSAELIAEVGECFLDGFTDEETGIMLNLNEETVSSWRSFRPVKSYELRRKQFFIREVRFGKKRDWTRIAWWLERRYPLEFSRPEVAHAISTSQHLTQNLTQNLVVTAETAQILASRTSAVSQTVARLFDASIAGQYRKSPAKEVIPLEEIHSEHRIDTPSAQLAAKGSNEKLTAVNDKTSKSSTLDDLSSVEEMTCHPPFSVDHPPPPPPPAAAPITHSLSSTQDLKNRSTQDLKNRSTRDLKNRSTRDPKNRPTQDPKNQNSKNSGKGQRNQNRGKSRKNR